METPGQRGSLEWFYGEPSFTEVALEVQGSFFSDRRLPAAAPPRANAGRQTRRAEPRPPGPSSGLVYLRSLTR